MIDEWAADFADSTAFALLPDGYKEHAVSVCAAFLKAACVSPDELDENAVRHAMLDHMPELDLPAEARRASALARIGPLVLVRGRPLQERGN